MTRCPSRILGNQCQLDVGHTHNHTTVTRHSNSSHVIEWRSAASDNDIDWGVINCSGACTELEEEL